MVENVDHVKDVSSLPFPLRQHVATSRFDKMVDKDSSEARALKPYIFERDGRKKRRIVSSGLSRSQTVQLITAFYLVCVEKVEDYQVQRAARLILYHYMLRRGYTARYLGKYQQDARFIGNGETTRKFLRLSQYDPHRLPNCVLNKLLAKNGSVRSKGSKGSRSKYVEKKSRYTPKQRLTNERRGEARQKMKGTKLASDQTL